MNAIEPADRLSFRLLAITPPDGKVPDRFARWKQAGALDRGLAVLLRTPQTPGIEVLLDPRFDRLRQQAADHEVPVLLGCTPVDLLSGALPAGGLEEANIAGIQLRGDPGAELLGPLREQLGLAAWIGRSSHVAPESSPPGFDHTCVSPIFVPSTPQPGKPVNPRGVQAIHRWKSANHPNVFALGGVNARNAEACISAGADGIAAIGAFFGEEDAVVENVSAFCAALA